LQIDAQKLFTHEKQLEQELARLRVQLTVVEEAKPPENANEESQPEPQTSLTDSDVEKVKMVNGDSLDSDATAVNTPQGTSTPKPAEEATEATETITAETVRLQILHLEKLLKFLEVEFQPTRQKLNDLLASNDIKFNLLWCLFRLGGVITFKDHESGLLMAGEV
jgi:hypothetical protein